MADLILSLSGSYQLLYWASSALTSASLCLSWFSLAYCSVSWYIRLWVVAGLHGDLAYMIAFWQG